MKKKLNLNALKVKSFVTSVENQNELHGGAAGYSGAYGCVVISDDCQQSDLICPHLTLNTCDVGTTPSGGTGPHTGLECETQQQQ